MAATNILNIGYDSTNYYLIVTSAPKLLVDVGWPGTLPKLNHNLKRYGVRLQDIPYVLITHYHPDHAGLAQEVKQQGAKLIVLENQVSSIPEMRKYMKPENHYVEIMLQDNVNLRPVEGKDFLARLGLAGEIIPTPGHSDDSVTLVLDDGLAFTGDLHPLEFATEDQQAKTTESWDKIRSLHVHTIYPGHGPVRPIR
jgi:glyoxylase-like metal-dependent hydrolase (beta-lactamase superfamily II)